MKQPLTVDLVDSTIGGWDDQFFTVQVRDENGKSVLIRYGFDENGAMNIAMDKDADLLMSTYNLDILARVTSVIRNRYEEGEDTEFYPDVFSDADGNDVILTA